MPDVVAMRGGELLVGCRSVPWFAMAVKRAAQELKLVGIRDADVDAYVAAVDESLRRIRGSDDGTRNVPMVEPSPVSDAIDPITPREAAEMLEVSPRAVLRQIERGNYSTARQLADSRWQIERAEVLARVERMAG